MSNLWRPGLNEDEIATFLDNSDNEYEIGGTNDVDDDAIDEIYDLPMQAGDFSDSGSSSVRLSNLESSDSGSESNHSDAGPILQETVRGHGRRGRGVQRRGSRRESRRMTTNGNSSVPSSTNTEHAGWSVKTFNPLVFPRIDPSYLPIDESSFIDKFYYFKHCIDDELIELMVLKTNQTYFAKNGKCLGLNAKELYKYLGITLVMSCIQYPQLRMYWQNEFRVPLVADNMARNRFFILRNSIKFVFDDNISRQEKDKDRLWKVRPLISKVQNSCRTLDRSTAICIDEMIIPFCGICGIKQYCPGKPNPTGLKAFVLANPDGTICDFCIYQGETTYPEYTNTTYSLSEKAVLNLTDNLVPGHTVYFDRYFTGYKLAEQLLAKGIMCAGTLMKNRIPAPVRPLLMEDRDMKRMGRGTMQVVVKDSNDFAITKWYDSKGITFLSTVHADQTIDTCQRWSKKDRQYQTVNRPEVVKAYNTNMGGVDLADRLLSVCPFRYRTKKWTQRFAAHMIDMTVSNSWLVFKKHELGRKVPAKKIQQLRSYKLELAKSMINLEEEDLVPAAETDDENEQQNIPPRKRGRSFAVALPDSKKRKKDASHLPEMVDVQNKCRDPNCKKKTKIRCSKCNMHLCLTKDRNCYKIFHTD